jgi:hypothetical protein
VASLGIAAALAIVSFLSPALLRPLNVAWFKLGMALNKIVSPLVMLFLFAVVIVPFGFVMQRFHDPLRKHRQTGSNSYWTERGKQGVPSSMLNQF